MWSSRCPRELLPNICRAVSRFPLAFPAQSPEALQSALAPHCLLLLGVEGPQGKGERALGCGP